MKHIQSVIILLGVSLSFAATGTGKTIRLFDENEINDAHKMNVLVKKIPAHIYRCLEDVSSDRSGSCSCSDRIECEYKAEVEKASNYYCKLRNSYPSWVGVSPNYMIEGDERGYVLDMESLDARFGRNCS